MDKTELSGERQYQDQVNSDYVPPVVNPYPPERSPNHSAHSPVSRNSPLVQDLPAPRAPLTPPIETLVGPTPAPSDTSVVSPLV